MSGEALRKARKQHGWTQAEAGARLGVSQAYVALLEKGRRPVPDDLARRAVREFRLSPVLLPAKKTRDRQYGIGDWQFAMGDRQQPEKLEQAAGEEQRQPQGPSANVAPQDDKARNKRKNRQSAVGNYKLRSHEAAKPGNEQQNQNEKLARDLSRLGYPGFAYMRGGWMKNPSEVLLTALAQPNLDSRLAEALPWLLLHYPDLNSDWLVREARAFNLTNRLGFVVDLARRVLERGSETNSPRYLALTRLSETLRASRLAVEDTFGQESLTEKERSWLRANRPQEAQFWNLLTNWQPEFLQYRL